MKSKILSILILIIIINSCNSNSYSSNTGETGVDSCKINLVNDINNIITPFIDSGFVGAVLLADSNEIILNRAYGRSKTHLDSATTFWIASNSKPIIAIAVMKLVEEGKLSVKDSLPQFFKNISPDKIHMTIEQLLTHSSGLPSNFVAEGENNLEKAIKKILSQKLISDPGEQFNYTNDGYVILAAIIEITSKVKYENYIRKTIFEKANMNHSNFWGDENIAVDPIHDSASYFPFYNKIFVNNEPLANWNCKGATGICSNTNDLYKLLIALRSGKLINQNSLLELFKPRYEIEKINDTILSYGYGWAFVDSKGKRIETRHRGRGDWMHNSSIYYLKKGYILIGWSRDLGPHTKPWSTEVCKKIIKEINKID